MSGNLTPLQKSCDEVINDAFANILPLYPNLYTGAAKSYLVYNYYVIPEVYAEGIARSARYSVQLHLYLPHKTNPNALKLSIFSACVDNGFTSPSMTNASDGESQHYVFEFEYANAGGFYGQT